MKPGEAAAGRVLRAAAALLAALAFLLLTSWYYLFREVPQPEMTDSEFFKYGSIGVEAANGIPYEIWRVLPRVFADKLPARGDPPDDPVRAYVQFGFLFENHWPTPVGLPLKRVGFERVGINCGLCHVSSVRADEGAPAKLVLGAPSTTLDLQSYLRFLFAAAEDPSFGDRVLVAIRAEERLSTGERLLFQHIVIPQTRRALLAQRREMAFMDVTSPWGPGRQDPFNPAKIRVLGLPYDGSLGNSDIMPLWKTTGRAGSPLHWDGLNTSLDEVFLNSAIGNGADADSVDLAAVERVRRFIGSLRPAPYPFAVDRALAAKGRGVFTARCASCHEPGEGQTDVEIPARLLGTDPARVHSWTQAAQQRFADLDVYTWRYRHFRETHGYRAVALDGVWARAPYLHNGSIPSLRDLLAPPELRPKRFYRGYDVYDRAAVGFQASGELAARHGWTYDTSERGNSNSGHLYGTRDLSDGQKLALVEYLKLL